MPIRRRLIPLAAVLAAALIPAAPAAAVTVTQTASSGPVTATFSFKRVKDKEVVRYRHLHLTVALGGQTVYDQSAATGSCAEPFCAPGGVQSDSIQVDDIDGLGPPDALLDLFTGGAHCCLMTEIVELTDTGIRRVEHTWGDASYALLDLNHDGVDEFISADDRFAYAFSAYAYSALPLQILAFTDGHFADVTGDFPGRVRADARLWRHAYRHTRAKAFPQGVFAAWTADRYRLGRRHAALRFARHAARHGKLRKAMGRKHALRFVRHLDRRLRRWGY